jgi:hypothetical protein
MKKVVVIGSKPDAVIPDGDAIYCANASIVYYADQVARFSRIVNISTPRVIDEQKPQSVSVEQDPVTAWGVLLNSMQAKLVILESSNASRMIDTLRKAGLRRSDNLDQRPRAP